MAITDSLLLRTQLKDRYLNYPCHDLPPILMLAANTTITVGASGEEIPLYFLARYSYHLASISILDLEPDSNVDIDAQIVTPEQPRQLHPPSGLICKSHARILFNSNISCHTSICDITNAATVLHNTAPTRLTPLQPLSSANPSSDPTSHKDGAHARPEHSTG